MAKPNPVESRRADILNIALIPAVARLPTTIPTERRNIRAREMLFRRIRAEFAEMPGLSVTLAQATRLFGLTREAASRILLELIRKEVLHMTADRRYVVRTEE